MWDVPCHTLRGCVDWNRNAMASGKIYDVTPCVGVWIETKGGTWDWTLKGVTPCVGVWIETFNRLPNHHLTLSHPAWVCGLKLWMNFYLVNFHSHTLRGCVDWNPRMSCSRVCCRSHPAWVCGLKHEEGTGYGEIERVTPCVGVWIETHQDRLMSGMRSHTLRGCVDWNSNTLIQLQGDTKSHPAWVCGLKRLLGHSNGFSQPVTPCVGVWIETKIQVWGWSGIESHTLRGCVDWNVSVEKSKTL